MKLQTKVLIVLGSLWIIVCLGIYLDSKFTLEHGYKNLEQKLAIKDMQRVEKALQNKLSALRLYTNSWSEWDDAYNFMITHDPKFIASNFVTGTFTSSNINFFLMYDNNGALFDGRAFDLVSKTFIPIPAGLLANLKAKPYFVIHKSADSGRVGMIKTPEGIIAISSLPILTSDGKGPIHGALLMGYFITPDFFKHLSETVGLKIDFISDFTSNHFLQTNNVLAQLKNQPYYFVPENSNTAYGFILLKDIDNNTIGIMRIELSRDIYNEGLITVYHYLLLVVLLGVISLITMIYLLKTLVLNPILSVSKQVIAINYEGKFQHRIKISGNDELNQMVASINSMLELIELTQEQLKYRISRRTKDMEKLSQLNRNLFKEMSKQRSIETKLREDEKLLRQMAYYDTLTGLANRTLFNELLEKALIQADHNNTKLAVLFIDIDKFKKMNDTYGHDFGDKLLKIVAQRLQQTLKDTDVAARLSGDEFILFISNVTNKDMIDNYVDSLFEQLITSVEILNIHLDPTFSVGISIYPDDGKTLEQLINEADLAMYYAKKQDGNSYRYYGAIENLRSSPSPYF